MFNYVSCFLHSLSLHSPLNPSSVHPFSFHSPLILSVPPIPSPRRPRTSLTDPVLSNCTYGLTHVLVLSISLPSPSKVTLRRCPRLILPPSRLRLCSTWVRAQSPWSTFKGRPFISHSFSPIHSEKFLGFTGKGHENLL